MYHICKYHSELNLVLIDISAKREASLHFETVLSVHD